MTPLRRELEERRLAAGKMLRSGVRQCKVAEQFAVSRTTVARWAHELETRGSLRARKAPGRPSRLTAEQLGHVRRVRASLTGPQLLNYIEREFGVHYDQDHLYKSIFRVQPRGDKRGAGAEPAAARRTAEGAHA